MRFARQRDLLYLSPFWSKYFWAYLDYGADGGKDKVQLLAASNRAAAQAMTSGATSLTGEAYGRAIRGTP